VQTRQPEFKHYRPDDQRDHDFVGSRDIVISSQSQLPQTIQHDRDPEWDADEIIEIAVDEVGRAKRLQKPPVHEVQQNAPPE
jgi:hypothetical protein